MTGRAKRSACPTVTQDSAETVLALLQVIRNIILGYIGSLSVVTPTRRKIVFMHALTINPWLHNTQCGITEYPLSDGRLQLNFNSEIIRRTKGGYV
jgi:hypothetical protein